MERHVGMQRLFAWSGLAMMVLFLVGFWPVAGYVPPSHPRDSVKEVLAFYTGDTTMIRLGLWMTTYAGALCITFFTVVTVQLRRIEGRHSPIAYAQMLCGALFAIEFIIPLMIWQGAAYRPELDPVMTYRLHDLGWLFFLGVVSTGVLQAILIGVAILRDGREQPIFPRWIGYTSLWCAVLFTPGGLIVFFKSGPLAWNGLIAWWLLLVGFGVWIVTLVYGLLAHAIPGQEREASTEPRSAALPASR